ncbi:MAG: N-acetylmuramoyl-L-alanine amidase [bacterium]
MQSDGPPIFVPFIDPGHGGDEPCSDGHGIIEAPYVYQIATILRDLVAATGKWGPLLSRDRHEGPSISLRDQRALRDGASFVFSIHADSVDADYHGFTALYCAANRRAKAVAESIARAMPRELCSSRTGRVVGVSASDPDYPRASNVVYGYTPPAVLLEVGYLSNRRDADYLKSPHAQVRIAAALLAGVCVAAQIY